MRDMTITHTQTDRGVDDVPHLCVVCTHGSIAEQRAAGIAEAGVREHIVIDFIIPGFDQLQDRLPPGG